MSEPPQIIEDVRWWTPEKAALAPWQIIALAAAATLLAAMALILYRRRKMGIPFFLAPPAHEVALRALCELETLLSEDRHQEFVIRISQILRTYIQDRFSLRAMHRSTEEFLREAQHDEQLSPEHQKLLGEFLTQCDMVKFARRGMALPQMEMLLQSARSFVEATPQPKPALAGKA